MKKILFLAFSLFALGCSTEEDSVQQPAPEIEIPVAKTDNLTAIENEELIIEKAVLLENDTRVDNARIVAFDDDTSAGGEVKDNRDGTLSYFPPRDFKGDDNFNYSLCVPGNSDRCSDAIVNIAVVDAGSPVAENDSYEISEDESFNISNFTENDFLIDNAIVTEVVSTSGNATVTLKEDGSILYVPNQNYSGEDSFTYTICDDDETPNCSTATITITVKDEGSPIAVDDRIVISDTTSEIVLENLLDNDNLLDDASIMSVDYSSASGKAVLNANGSVTYTPSEGFMGEDTFTYTLCDDDVEATCVIGTVTVNVVESISFNFPDYLEDYYGEVAFSRDSAHLFEALSTFTIAEHVNRLEYYQRHEFLYDADEDPSNPDNVILIYSGESRPEDEYWEGSTRDDWETFNTEHIYPQSKLGSEEAKNDMHHMRSADIDINETRSNYPYTSGSGAYQLVEGNKWYPGDDWRGDVARMVMYVNLRYGEPFEDVGSLGLFLQWNIEDPVSEFEMQRNDVIETAQGNRNPFIDNPYLATLIWGGADAENRWE